MQTPEESPRSLSELRARLKALSQRELDAYLDTETQAGRDDGPEWDVAYEVWESREGGASDADT